MQVFKLLQAPICYGALGEGYFFQLIIKKILLFLYFNESREVNSFVLHLTSMDVVPNKQGRIIKLP